jgi:hypothetical protein
MLVSSNLIESDQIIIEEVKLNICKHDPAVTFTRGYQGEVNVFYPKTKHINLFPY